jgi:two-component system sensor histidine kinase RegB
MATTGPLANLQEREIVTAWLLRLRWFAVAGQITAVAVAIAAGLRPPLQPVIAVIATTLATNIVLWIGLRQGRPPPWVPAAITLLDITLLTVLLFFTGGANNPFCTLYLVHVAMGVIILRPVWTWVMVAVSSAAYGLLFWRHIPLYPDEAPPPKWILDLGHWLAVSLVGALIAYFIGRVRGSLRQRERELAAAREITAKSEQLATLATLSAGAAHELGTPLGTIAVVARELQREVEGAGLAPEVVEDTRLIRDEVDRCRRILDRMRMDTIANMSRTTVKVAVSELIDGVVEDLQHGEDEHLKISVQTGLEQIVAPVRAVRQSLTVLVRNAFDASPPGSPIEMDVSVEGPHVVFRVTDHGQGMPEDVAKRAGEPFYTTKAPGKGMGLGLFLVRLVAERCGGMLRIRSEPGRGTTVEFRVQNVPNTAPDRRDAHSPARPSAPEAEPAEDLVR